MMATRQPRTNQGVGRLLLLCCLYCSIPFLVTGEDVTSASNCAGTGCGPDVSSMNIFAQPTADAAASISTTEREPTPRPTRKPTRPPTQTPTRLPSPRPSPRPSPNPTTRKSGPPIIEPSASRAPSEATSGPAVSPIQQPSMSIQPIEQPPSFPGPTTLPGNPAGPSAPNASTTGPTINSPPAAPPGARPSVSLQPFDGPSLTNSPAVQPSSAPQALPSFPSAPALPSPPNAPSFSSSPISAPSIPSSPSAPSSPSFTIAPSGASERPVTPTSSPAGSPVARPSPWPTITASPTRSSSPATTSPGETSVPTITPYPTFTRQPSPSPTVTAAPTRSLSPATTQAPTQTPSPTVTSMPSPSPSDSFAPTITPLPSASAHPSLVPTLTASPTRTITRSPAAGPEPTVSPSPTGSPTRTTSPTVTPSPTSSVSPTFICSVDESGAFGSQDGNGLVVNYRYQLETTTATTEAAVNNEIAPEAEQAFSTVVLPVFFPGECSSPGLRRLFARRLLQAIGYDSSPPDSVRSGSKCENEQVNEENNCFIADGAYTIYGNGADVDTEMIVEAQSALSAAMDDGAFNDIDSRVIKFTYVPSTDFDGGTGMSSSSGALPGYVWLIVGLGFAIMSVSVYFLTRSRRKSEQEEHIVDEEKVFIGEDQPSSDDGSYLSIGDWTPVDAAATEEELRLVQPARAESGSVLDTSDGEAETMFSEETDSDQ